MNREQLADFLRTRREALQPEDVGLTRGPRRRTSGLRREEVAALSGMSTDYYSRLEQERGPQPSEQMTAAIARGLHLSLDERDHLFRLVGHTAPVRSLRSDHVSPGMMRIVDRLQDTPAQVVTGLGEVLLQTPLAVALFGDETRFTGFERSLGYRWFTRLESRDVYPEQDHKFQSRMITADLRAAATRDGPTSRAADLVADLLERNDEFRTLWKAHEIGLRRTENKLIRNAEVGLMELNCQLLFDPDQSQALLVFTATPGSESYEKLQLLAVIGTSTSAPDPRDR